MSTRIDFTPMVDLGFLLITFFMLTTTLNKPQIMPVVFPEKKDIDEKDQEPVKESKVLTLLLGANDKVYYYEGITDPKLDSTDYSAEGIRKVILNKKDKVRSLGFTDQDYDFTKKDGTVEKRTRSQVNVLIKPMEGSRYKNVVDAFDEMAICNIAFYVLLDVSDAEKRFVDDPSKPFSFTPADQLESASGKKK